MKNVIDFIPIGSDSKPTSREELVMLTGLSDRAVRDEINHLKRDYPIVNMGAGYYVADDPDDPNLKAYIHQETQRIKSINRALRKHKALFKINKDQEIFSV